MSDMPHSCCRSGKAYTVTDSAHLFCNQTIMATQRPRCWFIWPCLVLIGWGSAAATSCYGDERIREERVVAIVNLIDAMPDWPFSPVVEDLPASIQAASDAKAMETTAHSIAGYDTEEIREAVRRVAANKSDRNQERLFILNQFLFEIPEKVANDSAVRSYLAAGYLATPQSVMVSSGWPWIRDENGDLRFCVKAHGIHRMGRPYRALRTFDILHGEFGRRSMKRQTEQPNGDSN